MTAYTGLCGFDGLEHQAQKQKALVGTGAQRTLVPSGYKGHRILLDLWSDTGRPTIVCTGG